ncbi:MAG: hypothetical protein M1484_04045 [Patescibacteria group bacterium]|nr:hypothetical protein [Patescibacteria group bacterium]MCL5432230.1 hypothetical protein [Patescibacteria group bacterium]
MKKKAVVPVKTFDEIRKSLLELELSIDPKHVLQEGIKEIGQKAGPLKPESNFYKALTVFEFDRGLLLGNSVSDLFRTFALDYFQKLRAEFDCKTPSENALAEIAAINLVRAMQTQQRINSILSREEGLSKIDIRFLEVLGQELDRANRHFLASMQALKTMRQPTMQVNIKTETAVVGQNQIVQANNHE